MHQVSAYATIFFSRLWIQIDMRQASVHPTELYTEYLIDTYAADQVYIIE